MGEFIKTLLAFMFAIFSVSLAIAVYSGGALFWHRQFGMSGNDLLRNEMTFYASQGYRTGIFLKEHKPEQKILLLTDQGFQDNENIKQLAYSIIDGYEYSEVHLDTVDIPDYGRDMLMPLYMTMTAQDFDRVVDKYPDAGVIISTIGLPADISSLEFLQRDDPPVLILLGLPSGPISGLADMIEDGKIAGIIISSPTAKYDVPPPKDRLEAFDIRYLLVTRENLAEHRRFFQD